MPQLPRELVGRVGQYRREANRDPTQFFFDVSWGEARLSLQVPRSFTLELLAEAILDRLKLDPTLKGWFAMPSVQELGQLYRSFVHDSDNSWMVFDTPTGLAAAERLGDVFSHGPGDDRHTECLLEFPPLSAIAIKLTGMGPKA